VAFTELDRQLLGDRLKLGVPAWVMHTLLYSPVLLRSICPWEHDQRCRDRT